MISPSGGAQRLFVQSPRSSQGLVSDGRFHPPPAWQISSNRPDNLVSVFVSLGLQLVVEDHSDCPKNKSTYVRRRFQMCGAAIMGVISEFSCASTGRRRGQPGTGCYLRRMSSTLDDLGADSRNLLAVRASKTATIYRFRSAFHIAAIADPRLIIGVIAVLQARGFRFPDGYRGRGCRWPFSSFLLSLNRLPVYTQVEWDSVIMLKGYGSGLNWTMDRKYEKDPLSMVLPVALTR